MVSFQILLRFSLTDKRHRSRNIGNKYVGHVTFNYWWPLAPQRTYCVLSHRNVSEAPEFAFGVENGRPEPG